MVCWWFCTFVCNMFLELSDFLLKTHYFRVHLADLWFKRSATLQPFLWFGLYFLNNLRASIRVLNCCCSSLERRSLGRLRHHVMTFVFTVSHKGLKRNALPILLKKSIASVVRSRGKFCTSCRGDHLIYRYPVQNKITGIQSFSSVAIRLSSNYTHSRIDWGLKTSLQVGWTGRLSVCESL